MIPSPLLGHDLSTAELYAITTAPQDAATRRRYQRWVERRLHRSAATTAGAASSESSPVAAVAPGSDPAPRGRRFRSPAAVRA